jgi:hypothetical protein
LVDCMTVNADAINTAVAPIPNFKLFIFTEITF